VHGWQFRPLRSIRYIILTEPEQIRHLVATREEERFLRDAGLEQTDAVGMPFLYAEPFAGDVERIPDSVLFLPQHRLGDVPGGRDETSFMDVVQDLQHRFETVVACVHGTCVLDGTLPRMLEAKKIPWVEGADSRDRCALVRMHRLFRSFEYVTSNAFGSHLPYAAYCGAKTSVYGELAAPDIERLRHHSVYIRFPELLDQLAEDMSERILRARFPFLFCEPRRAAELNDWASRVLGADLIRSPHEIAQLLGWSRSNLSNWLRMVWVGGTRRIRRFYGRPIDRLIGRT